MKKNKTLLIFSILLLMSLLLMTSISWCNRTFGKVAMDQLLYTILAPTTKTDQTIIISWVVEVFVVSISIIIIFLISCYIIKKSLKKKHKSIKLNKKYSLILGILLLAGSVYAVENNFKVIDYLNNMNQKTEIFEPKKAAIKKEEVDGDAKVIYADPTNVDIIGDDSSNLIYIYLESYENSFMDINNGGNKEVNCLPELTQLANENISFSNTEKLGGALVFPGTTWTIGSMVGQSSGLPLKVEVANNMDKYNEFMPGAIMIGDILAQKGYVQEFCIGGDASFGGTDKMFLQHGNYKIVDYNILKTNQRLKSDEYCEWGANDKGLIRIAKEEITNLANSNQKFNFTMATIDCHTTDGVRCSFCPKIYQNRYENTYACQSKQINDFITWCKEQQWYQDTTIVIVGDHNTMASKYVKDIPDNYTRTTYNCFINSKAITSNIKNRQFSHLDMLPTTLAAMGFKIEGNKLSLGTNLFSNLPTTIEEYGLDYIEAEVQKSSTFLDENIYKFN